MKLLIKETQWWGLHNPGEKVTDYEYDVDNLKIGEKVVLSTTQIKHDGSDKYVDEINLYFILVNKSEDKVELEIGSRLYFYKIPYSNIPFFFKLKNKFFQRKDFIKDTPFWIKEGKTLLLQEKSMDAGHNYSISLKR